MIRQARKFGYKIIFDIVEDDDVAEQGEARGGEDPARGRGDHVHLVQEANTAAVNHDPGVSELLQHALGQRRGTRGGGG